MPTEIFIASTKNCLGLVESMEIICQNKNFHKKASK